MPARRRKKVPLDAAMCSLQVTRGGVSIQLDGVAVSDVVTMACYLLDRFNEAHPHHPELEPPEKEFVQVGAYTPVEVKEDEGARRKKRVGF